MPSSSRAFTDTERAILAIVQKNLPDSLEPYADIAKMTGTSEEEVLELLRSLKEQGAIRRFGASIKHQKAGFKYNYMVAWKVNRENADAAGKAAAKHTMVSHCYFRPSSLPDWPYELYTMVHGQTEEECTLVIEDIKSATGLCDFAVLQSIKELKKTSMTYF